MNNGIIKTALFLRGLPETAAQTLLERLEPDCAENVRIEMMRISNVPQEKVKKTVSDFINAIDSCVQSNKRSNSDKQPNSERISPTSENRLEFRIPKKEIKNEKIGNIGNIGNIDNTVYENYSDKTVGFQKPVPNDKQIVNEPPAIPHISQDQNQFVFLLNLTPEQLYMVLQGESEQVIAVVLCYIPSKLASDLLSRYSLSVQKEIVSRLIQLEETDQLVLNEVVESLKNRTEEMFGRTRNRIGISVAKEILRNINPQISRTLISEFQQFMPELRIYSDDNSETNRDVNFREKSSRSINADFQKLQNLSDDDLYELYNSVNPQTAILSLVGADEAFINRIIQFYTPEQESRLYQRLKSLGPIDRCDVEKAREVVLRASCNRLT